MNEKCLSKEAQRLIEYCRSDVSNLNGGDGDFDGATLTIARDGGANAEDNFGIFFEGTVFNDESGAGDILSGGHVVASYTDTGGTLTITFSSADGLTPTSALVNGVLRGIYYSTASDTARAATSNEVKHLRRDEGGCCGLLPARPLFGKNNLKAIYPNVS